MNSYVTKISQGKAIGCKKYLMGEVEGRANRSKQLGGDIFQQTVNSLLCKDGKGYNYLDFLRFLGIYDEVEVNSIEFLEALLDKKDKIFESYLNEEGKKIYLFQNTTGTNSRKGIPIAVDISELIPEVQQKTTGYFDLLYLERKGKDLVIGGAEVKLATKPQEYHYDQLTTYLYFLDKKIRNLNIEGIRVSTKRELFLPSPSERSNYIALTTELSSLEKGFEVIRKKVEELRRYRIPPVSSDCLICRNLEKCIEETLTNNAVVAYKTLNSKRKDLYIEGCEVVSDVHSKLDYLWDELQIIPDKYAYLAEKELIENYDFWNYEKGTYPVVKKYRRNVKTVLHPYKTFLSIYALPSTRDVYDSIAFSITVITSEPKKVKPALERIIEAKVEGIKLGSPNEEEEKGNYYAFTVSAFKVKESFNLSALFKDLLISIFNLYRPRADEKGILQNERNLYIGFVDKNSKETTKRIFERFLFKVTSPKAINWIEKVFAGLGLKDKNIMHYYFRGSGSIITNIISGVFMTNEPFIFGYPSIAAVCKTLLKENPELNDNEVPYTLIFAGENLNPEVERFPVFFSSDFFYKTVANKVSLVDDIKLEESGVLRTGRDEFNEIFGADAEGLPFSYFPALTFLTALILFLEMRRWLCTKKPAF